MILNGIHISATREPLVQQSDKSNGLMAADLLSTALTTAHQVDGMDLNLI